MTDSLILFLKRWDLVQVLFYLPVAYFEKSEVTQLA